jgi:hypothetical protein
MPGSLVRALGGDDTQVTGLPATIPDGRATPPRVTPREPVVEGPTAVELATRRLKAEAQRRLDEAQALLHYAEAREASARVHLTSAEQSLEMASRSSLPPERRSTRREVR